MHRDTYKKEQRSSKDRRVRFTDHCIVKGLPPPTKGVKLCQGMGIAISTGKTDSQVNPKPSRPFYQYNRELRNSPLFLFLYGAPITIVIGAHTFYQQNKELANIEVYHECNCAYANHLPPRRKLKLVFDLIVIPLFKWSHFVFYFSIKQQILLMYGRQ